MSATNKPRSKRQRQRADEPAVVQDASPARRSTRVSSALTPTPAHDSPADLGDAAKVAMLSGNLFKRVRVACIEELVPAEGMLRRQADEIKALRAKGEDAAMRDQERETRLAEVTSRLEARERENTELEKQIKLFQRVREAEVKEIVECKEQHTQQLLRLTTDKAATAKALKDFTAQVERLRGFEAMVQAVRNTVRDGDA